MKIEEIKVVEESKSSNNNHRVKFRFNDKILKWFPMSKGYNRLLIVVAILVIIIAMSMQEREDEIWAAFFITIFFEILTYIAAVWVYHGFKDSSKT